MKIRQPEEKKKEAFVYYRDGMSAQAEGEYAEALQNYAQAMRLEVDPYDRSFIFYNIGLIRNRLALPHARIMIPFLTGIGSAHSHIHILCRHFISIFRHGQLLYDGFFVLFRVGVSAAFPSIFLIRRKFMDEWPSFDKLLKIE